MPELKSTRSKINVRCDSDTADAAEERANEVVSSSRSWKNNRVQTRRNVEKANIEESRSRWDGRVSRGYVEAFGGGGSLGGGGVVVLALPPFHCVTLDKSLAFSGPQLPVSGK